METEERASRWANGSNYNEYIQGEFNSFRKTGVERPDK